MKVYLITRNSIDWSDGRAYVQRRAFVSEAVAEATIRRENPALKTGDIEPYFSILEVEIEA